MNKADLIVDRRGTQTTKWGQLENSFGDSDLIPLWIADMDFATAPEIKEVLHAYVEQNQYGYAPVRPEYYQAIIDWTKKHFDYDTEKDWYFYTPGVCTGIAYVLVALLNEGDKVLIQNPVYNPFRTVVEEANRTLVMQDLLGDDETGYTIDFEALEKAFKEDDIKALLFCSPQNPTGRVWTEDELKQVVALCKQYDVLLISDEIHRDFVWQGHHHIAIDKVAQDQDFNRVITLTAGSKTFNLAQFSHSLLIVRDPDLRAKIQAFYDKLHLNNPGSPAGYLALEAAYRHGEDWLETIKEIIYSNYQNLRDILTEALPEIKVANLEATYLMWIDLGAYVPSKDLKHVAQDKAKLAVNYGHTYWPTKANDTHIRINLGTDPALIEQAGKNLVQAIKDYQAEH
ncbi:MalY/PatB family protein [Aerococcus tenax]|uniref:MalY/PatB family protein n=1 Tax=Aerococcus tenax TaxID=3078812 RepID=UPI0018A7A218|nr:PatB family C-S lyase [Aerococcus tenax]